MGECGDELIAAVNAVGEDMAQLWEPASQPLQQRDRSMAILNVGGMDVDGEQKAVGVGDDVPLAPVDALTGVEASRATSLGRWGTLTVDDGCRRTRLAAEPAARPPDQSCEDSLPPAGIAPSVEIALDRRARRKIARRSAPLAAGGQDVENRLDDPAQIGRARPAQSASRRKPPRDQRPLRIRHIACIAESVASILRTSDFSPRHRALPRIFANPKESQPAGITHSFFGQSPERAFARVSKDGHRQDRARVHPSRRRLRTAPQDEVRGN